MLMQTLGGQTKSIMVFSKVAYVAIVHVVFQEKSLFVFNFPKRPDESFSKDIVSGPELI